MDIEIDYQPAEDFCHVAVSGTLYLDDYRRAFQAAWAREDYVGAGCALWNFTEAQSRLSKEDLKALHELMKGDSNRSASHAAGVAARELAEFTRRGRPARLPKRIALVASNELDFGMMRIYAGYATFDDVDTRVFSSAESARAWLFEDGT